MTLRSQIFEYLREKKLKACLRVPERLVQKKNEKNIVFLRKRLTIVDRFEGLWSVGTRFRR